MILRASGGANTNRMSPIEDGPSDVPSAESGSSSGSMRPARCRGRRRRLEPAIQRLTDGAATSRCFRPLTGCAPTNSSGGGDSARARRAALVPAPGAKIAHPDAMRNCRRGSSPRWPICRIARARSSDGRRSATRRVGYAASAPTPTESGAQVATSGPALPVRLRRAALDPEYTPHRGCLGNIAAGVTLGDSESA